MIRTQKPLIIPDVHDDPTWVRNTELEWLRSYAGTPIYHGETIYGFISFHSQQPDFFKPEHAKRLKAFADQVAIALHNAHLYEQLQGYAQGLEVRVDERTAELKAQGLQLKTILDAIGEGVAYVEKHKILYMNRALSEMLGYEPEELPASLPDLHALVIRDDDPYQAFVDTTRAHLKHGQTAQFQVRIRRKDHSEFNAALSINRVDNPDGSTRGVVTVLRDISPEQELQAQRDRFLAHAAHELRTPLSNINTRLYLLRRRPENMEHHLDVMELVSHKMKALIEDLLDVVRLERHNISLNRQPLVLQQVVRAMLDHQQDAIAQKQITPRVSMPQISLLICADQLRLGQAINRLIGHAIHHTSDNGQIDIELTIEKNPQNVDYAVLAISDRETNHTPEQLDQLFDPFFSVNEADSQGVGLGLTLARQIVGLHRGEITAEARKDGGTTITVRLALWTECADQPVIQAEQHLTGNSYG